MRRLLAADWVRFGRRRDLRALVILVPVIMAALYVAEFNALTPFSDNLAQAPRLARWHELHGRNDQAHQLLVRALTRVAPEQLPLGRVARLA